MKKILLTTVCTVLVAALVGACATEPAPLDRTQPEALNKKMFTGEWYYNATTTYADWKNSFTFPGEQTDYYNGAAAKIVWEITPNLLNAYMIPQRYRKEVSCDSGTACPSGGTCGSDGWCYDASGKQMVGDLVENKIGHRDLFLSFKINKHYDIRYAYNQTTREDLNVIVENTDRPWQEREYMEVDWSQSLVTPMVNPMALDITTGDITREPVSVYENFEFFTHGQTADGSVDPDRNHDVKINTRKWNPATDPEVYAINIDLKDVVTTTLKVWWQYYYGPYTEPVTVQTRHSFMKASPMDQNTYEPRNLRDDQFRRFGFFRTEYEVYDPERMSLQGNKQYLIGRHNFANGNKLTWYASPDFQEQINEGDKDLKVMALSIIYSWNNALREALGLPKKPDLTETEMFNKTADDLIAELTPAADDPMDFHENEPLLGPDGKQVTNRDGFKRWKFEVGDLRYSFINFIKFSTADSAPLGYGPSVTDADTGEIVNSTVNVYGDWVDWVVRRMMDVYDLAAGNCTPDQMKDGLFYNPNTGKCDSLHFEGEYKGGILGTKSALTSSAAGAPKKPQRLYPLTPALMASYWPKDDVRGPGLYVTKEEFDAKYRPQLEAAWKQELTHPTQVDLGGFATIAGTRYESMMVPQANLGVLAPYAPSADDPTVVKMMSPAYRLSPAYLASLKKQATSMGHCRLDATAFEPSIRAFVLENKGKPRIEIYKRARFWAWYATALHEMGHTMGLYHNFKATADQRNFSAGYWPEYNKYWDQVEALRAQYKAAIDAGDPDAYMAFVDAVDQIPSTHDRYASTSIMDYMGDWDKWQMPVGAYDRAAMLLGYGNKVEVLDADYDPGKKYIEQPWRLVSYKQGDFVQTNPYDTAQKAESGRLVRYYMASYDDKIFDDAFDTRFDLGVTSTEITRNWIRDFQMWYFFRNFKRQRTNFDAIADGYYINRWLWSYYTMAKPIVQLQINSMWYRDTTTDSSRPQDDFWSSIFNGLSAISNGPEKRDMIPGYHHNGGEDLLRAALLYYSFLLHDVLARPDFGLYQLSYDTSGTRYWEQTDERYEDNSKPSGRVPTGTGWGWLDRHDVQDDVQQYDTHLTRIGVELDKIIAYEILSIPAVLNDPLTFEKANGLNFWNDLWTNGGVQLWEMTKAFITDNYSHQQNRYCMKCDANCLADWVTYPPQLKIYPVDLIQGLRKAGLAPALPDTGRPNPCGPDEYPLQPGMDALYAIYPIFFGIGGASHPWYENNLADHMDSQVKGGNHRFDIPQSAIDQGLVAEFKNSMNTKVYQAVQTKDGMGISYQLVKNGDRVRSRLDTVDYCMAHFNDDPPAALPADLAEKTGHADCGTIIPCYPIFRGQVAPEYCEPDGFSSLYNLNVPVYKYRDLDRIEAMLIMMQDMIDLAGHYAWRMPGYLDNDW